MRHHNILSLKEVIRERDNSLFFVLEFMKCDLLQVLRLRGKPFSDSEVSFKVDMRAIGAIMAELFMFKPLFLGRNLFDQMLKICSVSDSPTLESWLRGLSLAGCLNYQFPQLPGVNLSSMMPSASWNAISLIKSLCLWNPNKRPSVSEASTYPFFHA
ncbi:hypothetical protein Ddye_028442 [Dipteronia dyeriana]|uniref:Protein kinase domain-containing protein n=1 Tax=Dipteronia dyeriana TaxID=168575 RepID=A0AAD9TRH6_9ROSI|nr:hypothetical protein Ddye_028442 [Dipteronia dyeriana]